MIKIINFKGLKGVKMKKIYKNKALRNLENTFSFNDLFWLVRAFQC